MKLLILYLSILLLGVVLYTAFKKTAKKKELYVKLFSFALVAIGTYAFLDTQSRYAYLLYAIISILGIYEIGKAMRNHHNRHVYLSVSLIMLALFIYTGFVQGFPHSRLFLCVLSFDAFSQFFGQIFGRNALIRNISPNKTIEGCIGGLAICIVTSLYTFNSLWLGIYVAFFALCGDLLASMVKRRSGIKDFSNLLPGQGGVLDRFDSYVLCTVCYLPLL